ncbi:hypothetical protein D3C72_1209360 [compost metagenome]
MHQRIDRRGLVHALDASARQPQRREQDLLVAALRHQPAIVGLGGCRHVIDLHAASQQGGQVAGQHLGIVAAAATGRNQHGDVQRGLRHGGKPLPCIVHQAIA